jgi:hypothetical protein
VIVFIVWYNHVSVLGSCDFSTVWYNYVSVLGSCDFSTVWYNHVSVLGSCDCHHCVWYNITCL